jgi:hypothetical protein
MLEIALLWGLSSWIGRIVEQKGLTKWPYQLMLVLFWFGGQIAGFIVGFAAMSGGGGPPGDDGFLLMYGIALAGAVCGAVLAFIIANLQEGDGRPRPRPERERDPLRDRAFGPDGKWRDAGERWGDAQDRRRDAQEKQGRDTQERGREEGRVECRDCGFHFLAVLDHCPKCRLPANEARRPPGSDRITDR